MKIIRDALRQPRALGLVGGTVLLLALLLALGGGSSGGGEFPVLLANVGEPGELLRLADLFLEKGIPHRIEDGGRTLKVCRDSLAEAQSLVMENGFSGGGGSEDSSQGFLGFGPSLGLSPDAARARRRRRKEGELARTLSMYPCVQFARVHLNLPEADAFGRRAAPPSASVFLRLRKGSRLVSNQAKALRELMGAAVKGLDPERVVLADSVGTNYAALIRGEQNRSPFKRAEARFSVLKDAELRAEQKLTRQLQPLFGGENLSLSVSAAFCPTGDNSGETHVSALSLGSAGDGAPSICYTSVAIRLNSDVLPGGLAPDVQELVSSTVADTLGAGPKIGQILRLKASVFVGTRKLLKVGKVVVEMPIAETGAPEDLPSSRPVGAGGEFGIPLGLFLLMLGTLGVARYSRAIECRPVAAGANTLPDIDGLRDDPCVRRASVAGWAEDDPEFAARVLSRLLAEDRDGQR